MPRYYGIFVLFSKGIIEFFGCNTQTHKLVII